MINTGYCFLIVSSAFVFSPQSSGMEDPLKTDVVSLSTFYQDQTP